MVTQVTFQTVQETQVFQAVLVNRVEISQKNEVIAIIDQNFEQIQSMSIIQALVIQKVAKTVGNWFFYMHQLIAHRWRYTQFRKNILDF